ncbi:unnamed protein product [Mytilus coruscus]|uniref:Uncharacterized protein n=1 Tax=Mytilus coruscus TaxID=42192 RepID=A0A6J8DY32_MYTCO|nr:unnamed protein product [Mytilus coruscus]
MSASLNHPIHSFDICAGLYHVVNLFVFFYIFTGAKQRSSTEDTGNKQKSSTDDTGNKQRSSTENTGNKQRSSTEDTGTNQRSSTEDTGANQRSSTEDMTILKLQNKIKALQAKKLPVPEEDELMKAMKIDFMSSEDSDSEDETRLITRPMNRLSKDFTSYMDKLDSKYQRQLNAHGKTLRSKRVVGRPSERPCPNKSQDLAWVFA